MSKKDDIKADIDTTRAFMLIVVTAVFGMIGYLIVHLNDELSIYQIILGILAFVCLLVIFVVLGKHYFKIKKSLRRLK